MTFFMNNNEFRCNCVEMTRAIKNKIDMEIANMSPVEVAEYLQKRRKRKECISLKGEN